ncbi:tetratricopeptide repeat protein [Thermocrinis sp.]
MGRRLILLAFLISSCGGVTQEELNLKLSQINRRITQLEEQQKRIEAQQLKTEERIDALSQNLANLRLEFEKTRTAQNIPVIEHREEIKAKTSEQPVKGNTSKDYEKEYQEALNFYNLRQLNQAKDKFIEFIKNNPKTPLTDNAYLWLGVIYRDLGDLQRAEAVWRTLEEKCKKGELVDCNKLPSAYLQLARIYENSGDAGKAKEYYEMILKEFPLSDEANIAKTKLGR